MDFYDLFAGLQSNEDKNYMTTQTKKLYDTDYNLWLLTTAQLLRERQFDQIDYEKV